MHNREHGMYGPRARFMILYVSIVLLLLRCSVMCGYFTEESARWDQQTTYFDIYSCIHLCRRCRHLLLRFDIDRYIQKKIVFFSVSPFFPLNCVYSFNCHLSAHFMRSTLFTFFLWAHVVFCKEFQTKHFHFSPSLSLSLVLFRSLSVHNSLLL